MATSEQPKATGILYKRQRGINSNNLKGLKWQRRRIRLMPKEVEYYGAGVPSSTTPNGKFFVDRIKIVEKIPEATFRKKYCFQVKIHMILPVTAVILNPVFTWMCEFNRLEMKQKSSISRQKQMINERNGCKHFVKVIHSIVL